MPRIENAPRTPSLPIEEVTFGIEIECFINSTKARQHNIVVGAYHHGTDVPEAVIPFFNGKPWKAMRDGSIRGRSGTAVEFVSPVLSGREGMLNALAAVKAIKETLGGRVNVSCGFHVHVGFKSDRIGDLRRLMALVSGYEPGIYAASGTTRRVHCNWCKSGRHGYKGNFFGDVKPEKTFRELNDDARFWQGTVYRAEGSNRTKMYYAPNRHTFIPTENSRMRIFDADTRGLIGERPLTPSEKKDEATFVGNNTLNLARGDRYQLLNVLPLITGTRPAVEFRAFSGTLNPTKIAAFIGLCVGLVQVSSSMSGKKLPHALPGKACNAYGKRCGQWEREAKRLLNRIEWKGDRKWIGPVGVFGQGCPSVAKMTKIVLDMARKMDAEDPNGTSIPLPNVVRPQA